MSLNCEGVLRWTVLQLQRPGQVQSPVKTKHPLCWSVLEQDNGCLPGRRHCCLADPLLLSHPVERDQWQEYFPTPYCPHWDLLLEAENLMLNTNKIWKTATVTEWIFGWIIFHKWLQHKEIKLTRAASNSYFHHWFICSSSERSSISNDNIVIYQSTKLWRLIVLCDQMPQTPRYSVYIWTWQSKAANHHIWEALISKCLEYLLEKWQRINLSRKSFRLIFC